MFSGRGQCPLSGQALVEWMYTSHRGCNDRRKDLDVRESDEYSLLSLIPAFLLPMLYIFRINGHTRTEWGHQEPHLEAR